MSVVNLSRRTMLKAGGATALVLGWSPRGATARSHPRIDDTVRLGAETTQAGSHLNDWIRISTDGTVTLRMGAVEMGQGITTALPMILAEELDCAWERVRVESVPVSKAYGHTIEGMPIKTQSTGGSASVRGYWMLLREAGASARAMLVAAAAEQWGVRPEDCTTEASVVHCGERSADYGSLVERAATQTVPRKVPLKSPADFRLIGTSPPRLDLPDKITGRSPFGLDVQLDGLQHAAVVWCPHYGGRLLNFDATDALAMPGVVDAFAFQSTFIYGDAVVVIADSTWRAQKAAAALQIQWNPGAGAGLDDAAIHAALTEALDAGTGRPIHRSGRFDREAATLSADYRVPHLEHATLEPLNATVHLTEEGCRLWAGVQSPPAARKIVAKVVGLKEEQVLVHTTMLGGGFGRRSELDAVEVAAAAALRVDAPVKVTYTRAQCFAKGAYRPTVQARFHADLSDGFRGWSTELAGQNCIYERFPDFLVNSKLGRLLLYDGFHKLPYNVPHQYVGAANVELPITSGFWRSVHGSHNGFFRECFFDEVAHALGRDPADLRLELLSGHPRERAVLELALEKAGPVPEGQHRGVALFHSYGSDCAQACDVSFSDGQLTIHRVTAAIDAGTVVHPDSVKAQVEGAIVMGLSSAIGEGLTFAEGAVVATNFHQYPLLTLAQTPRIDVHIVPSAEPPGGVGEPGLPPTPAALCNAIFAATGKRIRTLPIADQLRS